MAGGGSGGPDSHGTIHDPNGIDVADLIGPKEAGTTVTAHVGDRRLDREAVLDIDCDSPESAHSTRAVAARKTLEMLTGW